MMTPVKTVAAKEKEKEKDNSKRLARCGKCTNCKSSVRAMHSAATLAKFPA